MSWMRKTARKLLMRSGCYAWFVLAGNPFKVLEYLWLSRDIPEDGRDVVLDFGCGTGIQMMLNSMQR